MKYLIVCLFSLLAMLFALEADAGSDQEVEQGTLVELDGSESSWTDTEDNASKFYHWSLVSPVDTEIELSDSTTMRPEFTAPDKLTEVEYTFNLIIEQFNEFSDPDEVIITVKENQPPTAISGNDINVYYTNQIHLNAMASFDVNNDFISYQWTAPEGIELSDFAVAQPTFTISDSLMDKVENEVINTDFQFSLIVTDINDEEFVALDSEPDTVTVTAIVTEPSAPLTPNLYARVEHMRVILNWDKVAEESIDGFTGYSDFEGYKIYRSTDGGITWGDEDDRIYNFDGDFIGWEPYNIGDFVAQFDLTENQDETHCVYSNSYDEECDETRGREYSGLDSLSESSRFDWGENTGLEHSFIDENVLDGVEYTYAVTAYDIGLHTYTETFNETDGNGYGVSWSSTNPGHFIGPGGNGLATMESLRGYTPSSFTVWEMNETYNRGDAVKHSDRFWVAKASIIDGNEIPQDTPECPWKFVSKASTIWYDDILYSKGDIVEFENQLWISLIETPSLDSTIAPIRGNEFEDMDVWQLMYPNLSSKIRPGFYASNITFPDLDNAESFIVKSDNNIGNGFMSMAVINESDLIDDIVKFEIQAEFTGSTDLFEDLPTENPKLYIYGIESIINPTPTDYISVMVDELDSLELIGYLDYPGSIYNSDSTMIMYPASYKIENFPIDNILNEGWENNWTEFFDGIRMRTDNAIADWNKIDEVFDGYVPIIEKLGYVDEVIDTNFANQIEVSITYKNQSGFSKRPPYTYKIEFSTSIIDSAVKSTGSGCDGTPFEDGYNNAPLPLKITNLTTNKRVGIFHTDKGYLSDVSDDGFSDCFWERNEQLAMKWDTVSTNGEIDDEYIFNMYIDFKDYSQYLATLSPWVQTKLYEQGDVVSYAYMAFEATQTVSDTIPTKWVGNSTTENANPWKPIYPWEDGSYIIVEPMKWFVDGDSWVADLSLLGDSHQVTQKELERIKVVPNPFIVQSKFSTSSFDELHFTQLPQECTLTIYTVTGETVAFIDHSDPYKDTATWDLTNEHNQEVAPGLYIYVAESGGKKHIGKFAIVR